MAMLFPVTLHIKSFHVFVTLLRVFSAELEIGPLVSDAHFGSFAVRSLRDTCDGPAAMKKEDMSTVMSYLFPEMVIPSLMLLCFWWSEWFFVLLPICLGLG